MARTTMNDNEYVERRTADAMEVLQTKTGGTPPNASEIRAAIAQAIDFAYSDGWADGQDGEVWVTEMDSETRSWIGTGRTKAEAERAILKRWRKDPRTDKDVDLATMREQYGVRTRRMAVGTGYADEDEGLAQESAAETARKG
jgi:hypothetical protein